MNQKQAVTTLEKKIGSSKAPKAKKPVSPKRFIESPKYMNAKGTLYPEILKALIELTSGGYSEAVLTGGIGCGKTTLALYCMAYQLYLLSCMEDPHATYGLDPTSEIAIVFQSVNADLAKIVDFRRFKELIARAPYFRKEFSYISSTETELRFPKRIVVCSLTGSASSALGQNLYSGIVDEVNFMANRYRSKLAVDGGSYNQAEKIYDSITNRRKSRFMRNGRLAGMLCLVSSKRYPGEFTEQKIAEASAQATNLEACSNPIYVFDKRAWEVKPKGAFSGQMFGIFTGNLYRLPRILDVDEVVSESQYEGLIDAIPIEYLSDFQRDIHSALRDIAGVATGVIHPFIHDREAIAAAFGETASILSRPGCDFVETGLDFCTDNFRHRNEPRFAHIDLAFSSDSAGIACGHVDRFVDMESGEHEVEVLPQIIFDFVLEVRPPKNGEINFKRIRTFLYNLRNHGLPIHWVSMDSYQSKDMEQLLKQHGFKSGQQSMDRTTKPYDLLKTALQDGRALIPSHDKAMKELVRLERDPVAGRIDHPAGGSKDLADAIAGVAHGLTMRREIWHRHGILPTQIPAALLAPDSPDDLA
jgi:hypothetical protein